METTLDLAEAAVSPPAQHARNQSATGRWPSREHVFGELDPVAEPIVVVGSGPVGVRTVQELTQRAPDRHIIWYGAERGTPYDRVHLTSLLAGKVGVDDISDEYSSASYARVERRFGCPIMQIDRNARLVIDRRNRFQSYSTLILATGSTPRIPECIDTKLPGVFTLYRLKDANALAEQRRHSRCTVVLGGGMLGLESARAMLSADTKVIIIEQGPRLLARQLDEGASALLKQYLETLGIDVLLNAEVEQVYGETHLQCLMLKDRAIPCDTLIIATGTDPNVELAHLAGLEVNRGIQIDDRTVTSDPNIQAVGECTEHRGVLYGTVNPGLEQARVAAAVATGAIARYTGSLAITRLKVLEMPVFSMLSAEDALDGSSNSGTRTWTYRSKSRNSRVRLFTRQGRIVGACAIGHGIDIDGLQQAVEGRLELGILALIRFLFTGKVWRNTPSAQPERKATAAPLWQQLATRGNPDAELDIAGSAALSESLAAATPVIDAPGSSASLRTGEVASVQPQQAAAGQPLTFAATLMLGLSAQWAAHQSGLMAAPAGGYPDSMT